MSYSKVNNAIAAAVHEEKLDVIKQLKVFLESKMDDTDEIGDLINEFSSTLTTTKVKAGKKSSSDKPKRTRKPSFYNFWLGNRLRTFGEEQALLPKDERVPKKDRMRHVTVEWKELKADTDAFNEAKTKESYDYLIKMPIWNLTYEKKEELLKELNNKKDMLSAIEIKTIESMWLDDLEVFDNEYNKYLQNRLKDLDNKDVKSKKKISK